MFKTILYTVLAAAALSVTASATTVTPDLAGTACPTAGLCTSVAGAHQISFDGATVSPFVDGNATFTFSPADVSPFVNGSLDGNYAAPPNDNTRYLSIG